MGEEKLSDEEEAKIQKEVMDSILADYPDLAENDEAKEHLEKIVKEA